MARVELPFNLDNTLGALLIGGLVTAGLWGVTSAQACIYYQRYPKDPLTLKLIVALLWVLDTFEACLTSHILYYYLVRNQLNPLAIATPVWSVFIYIGATSVTDAIIRSLFAQRVWTISDQNIILTSIVGSITFCDLIVGLMISVKVFWLQSYAQLGRISTLLYVNFGTGISGDLFVAIILCYYLFRSRTGFRRTDTLVNTFIAYIITTGLLASVDVILGTFFYATMPKNFIFIGFYFSMGKVYINSYLALLNSRKQPREKGRSVSFRLSRLLDQPHATDFGLEGFLSGRVDKTTNREIEVCIQTTVDCTSDPPESLSANLALATTNAGKRESKWGGLWD